ncbi:MAG: xanthine dehydrogenase accessory protein XdhC [Caldimonas sp.]
MSSLRTLATDWLDAGRRAVVVEVVEARGSAPREAGTRMLVDADSATGTIGGGHLELKAIDEAREMLRRNDLTPRTRHYPLGPALGQCCGGAVTLGLSALDRAALDAWPETAPRFHLQLYGAGHVGRAIARALAPMNVRVDWIDEREDEFPASLVDNAAVAWPPHIRAISVDGVEGEVATAPPGAFYLVLTHRHDLDLRIAEAILRRADFGFFGLIGSKTKRRQFIRRFEERGIAASSIARMTCPIGLPGIDGKEPETIAAAVVAQLLLVSSTGTDASDRAGRHAACPETETLQASEIDDGNHRREPRAATGRGKAQDSIETTGRAPARQAGAAPLVAAGHRNE